MSGTLVVGGSDMKWVNTITAVIFLGLIIVAWVIEGMPTNGNDILSLIIVGGYLLAFTIAAIFCWHEDL